MLTFKAIHLHPNYSSASAYNDIGLVELDSDVNYSPLVYPVCLFTAAAIPLNNTELYATRWGMNIFTNYYFKYLYTI